MPGLSSIGENAFEDTKMLKDIRIPYSMKTIKTKAFKSSGITRLTFDINQSAHNVNTLNIANDAFHLSSFKQVEYVQFNDNVKYNDTHTLYNINRDITWKAYPQYSCTQSSRAVKSYHEAKEKCIAMNSKCFGIYSTGNSGCTKQENDPSVQWYLCLSKKITERYKLIESGYPCSYGYRTIGSTSECNNAAYLLELADTTYSNYR